MMQIGLSIALFIGIALVLMILFCLLLKYYAFKRKKNKNAALQIVALSIDSFKQSEVIYEGAYNQFKTRQTQTDSSLKPIDIHQDNMFEQTNDLRIKINLSNDIYGLSSFSKRLTFETAFPDSFIIRQTPKIKQIFIQKLQEQDKHYNEIQPFELFTYVKRLVQYSYHGLYIIQITKQKIYRQADRFLLTKKVKQEHLEGNSQNFSFLLQINGFQEGIYESCKYVHSLNVGDMKLGSVKRINEKELNLYRQTLMLSDFGGQKELMYHI